MKINAKKVQKFFEEKQARVIYLEDFRLERCGNVTIHGNLTANAILGGKVRLWTSAGRINSFKKLTESFKF